MITWKKQTSEPLLAARKPLQWSANILSFDVTSSVFHWDQWTTRLEVVHTKELMIQLTSFLNAAFYSTPFEEHSNIGPKWRCYFFRVDWLEKVFTRYRVRTVHIEYISLLTWPRTAIVICALDWLRGALNAKFAAYSSQRAHCHCVVYELWRRWQTVKVHKPRFDRHA